MHWISKLLYNMYMVGAGGGSNRINTPCAAGIHARGAGGESIIIIIEQEKKREIIANDK